jgi:hypothetical protein
LGAKQGANIITGAMTAVEERKVQRTLENVNTHCNYSLYYAIKTF